MKTATVGLCGEAETAFGDSLYSCEVCIDNGNATCAEHPLIPAAELNVNMIDYMVTAPQKYVPVVIKFVMKDEKNNRAGNLLRFVFPSQDDNLKFLKFLANDDLGIGIRKSMLSDTYKNIKEHLGAYVEMKKK